MLVIQLNIKIEIFLVTESNFESMNKILCYNFIFKEGSRPTERRYNDIRSRTALLQQALLASEQHAAVYSLLFADVFVKTWLFQWRFENRLKNNQS